MSDENTLIVKLEEDGPEYELDMGKFMLSEANVLKKHTGMNRDDWKAQLAEGDPECWQFFVWLVRSRAGENPGRVSEIDADLFAIATRPKVQPAEDAEPEANPTGSPESDSH